MAEKQLKRVKGFSNNGAEWPGRTEFDQDYINVTIFDKVERTGEGDDDFSVVKDVRYDKQPIKEVVEADAESVGVYNIMKQVLRTGDTSLLPVDKGNPLVDIVDAPENLMELKAYGEKAEANFRNLPDDLTKGLDMKAFAESLTQEQFDAFIKAVSEKFNKKSEVKENE